MRILMWVTIGFGLACGLWAWLFMGQSMTAFWILSALAALVLAAAGKKRRRLRALALIAMGLALGFGHCGRFQNAPLAEAEKLDGKTCYARIRAADFPYAAKYGRAVDGELESSGQTVRVYLDKGGPIFPGDRIEGIFRFRLTTKEEADTYHPGRGIFLLAYQEGEVTVSTPAGVSWKDFPVLLRQRLLDILDESIPEDAAPFARALLLGDTSGLDYETDTSLKVSGVRHVVAVSGLHVSILFALLSTVTFRNRYLTALVGFPALLLFAAVAGFTPSVTRACIMAGLMLLAELAGKEYDRATALSFAVLAMLLWNPLVITDVGFQLSVASVAGIFLFQASIYGWLIQTIQPGKKKPGLPARWLSLSVSVTLSAMVLTAPLSAWHFHTVSLVGVVTNLLTLWLISGLFYGLMAVCLLGAVWPAGAAVLGNLLSWPIRYILFITKFLAGLPLAAVYTRSIYIVVWLVLVYALLAVFLGSKHRRPLELICCACLGLFLALGASLGETLLADARITVLDVGQGQCILLEGAGRTYMVDCGGEGSSIVADLAAETLLSRGITRLDGLILTHLDEDHACGAENFLTRIPADLLILPPQPGCPEGNGQRIYAREDLEISWEGASIRIFAPKYPGTSSENSLCVLFDSEKCDILITGDRNAFGERSLLRNAVLTHVDVLVAGHHGSAGSTCRELLEAVTPEIVCISAGRNNPFGHPAGETLARLRECNCEIYRTDQCGTITIRR